MKVTVKTFLALTLPALSACTANQRVGVLASTTMALVACDVAQTVKASNYGRWDLHTADGHYFREGNPLLGSTPSMRALMFKTVVDESSLVVAAMSSLPEWAKYTIFGVVSAVEAVEIAANAPRFGFCGGRSVQ